jgi:peptide-methionine (R)-S-oxide reductase
MGDSSSIGISRRAFLVASASVAGRLWLPLENAESADARRLDSATDTVTIVEFSERGERLRRGRVPKISKRESAWKQMLAPEAFEVTRHAATERPFSGRYWNLHDKGLYRCICCDTAVFSSSAKYDSGTGWPSFWEPIARENIETSDDRTFGMARTAVSCRAPRPGLRRWPATDWLAVLHEFSGVAVSEGLGEGKDDCHHSLG